MNNKKIGNFLIDLRNEFNLTQEELSQKISVSRSAISKWERGINVPPPEVLLELSKIYNVSVNEILNGERDSNNNIKTENKTSDIFTIYLDHADKTYQTTTSPERIVIDFIAGMTDEYFINSIHHLKEFSYSKQEQ